MAATVLMTDDAARDLDELYAQMHSAGASAQETDLMLDRIQSAVESLAEEPLQGRIPAELREFGNGEYRELHVEPYRFIYLLGDEVVHLLMIGETRRSLGSLLQRRLLES